MFDMIRLALETDSTRLVTVFVNSLGVATDIPGVTHETHSLTHHGNRPETLAELRTIEDGAVPGPGRPAGGPARRRARAARRCSTGRWCCTAPAWAAPTRHSNVNLPVLLAGGGFRHAGHLAFDTKKNYPLPNLYVSMLQRLGVEADKFASSTGTMRGLDLV